MGGGLGGSAASSESGENTETGIVWIEAKLKAPTALTGERTEEDEITLEQHLHRLLQSSEWDPKPTLLYFHHDHDVDEEEGEKLTKEGKASLKQCGSLNDETVARWSQLYRFVEVDVPGSDADLLERFQAGDGPSFTVINQDLEVVARSDTLSNSKAVVSFLKTTVKKGVPEYWKTVQERLDAQKKALDAARAMDKKKDYLDALDKVREVTSSSLRVGEHYDEALELGQKIRKKID